MESKQPPEPAPQSRKAKNRKRLLHLLVSVIPLLVLSFMTEEGLHLLTHLFHEHPAEGHTAKLTLEERLRAIQTDAFKAVSHNTSWVLIDEYLDFILDPAGKHRRKAMPVFVPSRVELRPVDLELLLNMRSLQGVPLIAPGALPSPPAEPPATAVTTATEPVAAVASARAETPAEESIQELLSRGSFRDDDERFGNSSLAFQPLIALWRMGRNRWALGPVAFGIMALQVAIGAAWMFLLIRRFS
jgi:hypothetical protein